MKGIRALGSFHHKLVAKPPTLHKPSLLFFHPLSSRHPSHALTPKKNPSSNTGALHPSFLLHKPHVANFSSSRLNAPPGFRQKLLCKPHHDQIGRLKQIPLRNRQFCTSSAYQTISKQKPLKVLFFGTGDFAFPTLKLLFEDDRIDRLDIVTKGTLKKDPIPDFALRNQLYCYPYRDKNDWKLIKPLLHDENGKPYYDVGVIASFGALLPSFMLDQFSTGLFNLHPSLLPLYRGPAPIFHMILNADKIAGISVISVSKEMDQGRVLLRDTLSIETGTDGGSGQRWGELNHMMAEKGAGMLATVLKDPQHFIVGSKDQREFQHELNCLGFSELEIQNRLYAPKIKKDMGQINFAEMDPQQIYHIWRAVGETLGVKVYFHFNGKKYTVKLAEIEPPTLVPSYKSLSSREPFQPGQFLYDKKTKALFIKCKDGWVATSYLHVDFKKKLTAETFCNGYQILKWREPSNEVYFSEISKEERLTESNPYLQKESAHVTK